MSPILFLILMIAGTNAKAVDRPSDNSINKTDEGPYAGDNGVPLTLTDATTRSPTSTAKPSLLTWFLAPLTQNFQLSPQTLQDRITQFKETLTSLALRNREDPHARQLGNANNLLQLVGANDSGFYTNRIEPAGFFGGNGWLANKGGILGGPGAILSTGSILTDYPTAYRRK